MVLTVRLAEYAEEIKKFTIKESEIAIVIGGGNIFRGVAGASNGMDRVKGLHGNASHIINGMASRCLRRQRDAYRLQTALK
jgi:uridylate kinase